MTMTRNIVGDLLEPIALGLAHDHIVRRRRIVATVAAGALIPLTLFPW